MKPSAQALFEHVYQRYPERNAGVQAVAD